MISGVKLARFGILVLISLLFQQNIFGQEELSKDSAEFKSVGVLAFPTFGYEPETSVYTGAAAFFTLHLFKDTLQRPSNADLEFTYTLNRQSILDANWTLLFKEEKFILIGANSVRKFPEYFWGIGNNVAQSDSEIVSSNRIELTNIFLKQVRPKVFIGIKQRLQHMYNVEYDPNGTFYNTNVPGKQGGPSSGIGYVLNYDSRDHLLTPSEGSYIWFSNTFFLYVLGSAFSFNNYEFEARKYIQVRKVDVLALQTFNQFNFGTVPVRMLSLMGSDSDMRGYYRGQYRDKQYITFQAEYRMNIYKRWGITAFSGVGQVASKIKDLAFDRFKPSVGGGIRFMIDREDYVNARVDFAWGKNTSGFYIAFAEAF